MKWGVRRSRSSDSTGSSGGSHGHSTSTDAEKAKELATRAKTVGTHTLSNQELEHLTKRMNLEQQYSRLSSQGNKSRHDAGAKIAKEILLNVGKQHVTKVLAEGLAAATKSVGKR